MKKSWLVYGAVALGATLIIALIPKGKKVDNNIKNERAFCSVICEHIKNTCNQDLINNQDCQTACNTWGEEFKQALVLINDCELITTQIEAQAQVAKEAAADINNPNVDKCNQACNNYVNRCLTLVPNATPQLFEEGFNSCKTECASWNITKIDCMIQSNTCEAFTDVCGL